MFFCSFKRFALLVLSACIIVSVPHAAAAADENTPVALDGVSAFLLAEASTGRVVIEKNAEEKLDAAGLSKLPALLLLCESVDAGRLDPDSMVTVSREAAAIGGPSAFLEAGENIKAAELLKAAVMISAGDAIYALGEALSGTETAFVLQVNERMRLLGIDAQYAGVNEYTPLSAAELSMLGRAALDSRTYISYSALYLDSITHEDERHTELVNPNRLVRELPGCGGILTGSSKTAGYCGVFTVSRSDTEYVCAVMGAPDSASRFAVVREAVEYAFAAFHAVTAVKSGELIAQNIPVLSGMPDRVDLVAKQNITLLVRQGEEFKTEQNIPEALNAPLRADEPAGYIQYRSADGALLAKVDLYPSVDASVATMQYYVHRMIVSWLHAG